MGSNISLGEPIDTRNVNEKKTCPTNYKFKAMQSTSPWRKLGKIF